MTRANPTAKKRPRKVAPTAAREPDVVARGEVLGFAAQLLPALPLEIKIGVQANGLPGVIHIASKSHTAGGSDATRFDGGLWFDGDELRALAIAAQSERIWSSDFKGYCLRKLHDPSFRVTEATALSGARSDAEPAEGAHGLAEAAHGLAEGAYGLWSLGRVLHWLELDLVAIEFVEPLAVPAVEASRAPDAAAA